MWITVLHWENIGGMNIAKKDYLKQFEQPFLEKMIREFELEDKLPGWYDKSDCLNVLAKEKTVTFAKIDAFANRAKRK